MNNNIIEFYLKVMNLKNVDRSGWKELGITNPESIMDHIGGTVMLAMSINAEKELNLDMSKVYEMIAISEIRKLDQGTPEDFLNILSNNTRLLEVFNEYKEGTTREANFASMVLKLESDMQAKKYEMDGVLTLENAIKDIERYPEDVKANLTNISKPSEGWLEYNKKYYDDMFLELSNYIEEK